ncbi:NERD domain-containing protein/DEAD/DEAH box helicase [Burkholderiaceae bacterium FT117]|uniref:ATP-binding domain-containing protein n=1 Tax=Zeimonas sediminis TaxID=2944268 RepID=UPI002342EAC1|nr:ATP-binding domain-containing protein [Zeimonas sediminis]MCM5571099.1 NERD domain-containing protein/DEAD/DEAH box helicase [Zeimonas sediminis]
MARIVPEEIDAAKARGQARREIETLEALERELSAEYTVYHGVHWAHSDASAAFYGEIDFVVVNRCGRAIAIEQKNGGLESDGQDLLKRYGTGAKSVSAQVGRNLRGLMREFSRRFPKGGRLDIDHLLYLPDHALAGPTPASVDPARVVDARSPESLAKRIEALFDERPMPASQGATGLRPADASDVHAFLSERLDLVPSIDAISRNAREQYARLSGGLATWARRLSMQPFRLRVRGTAGSGKTQLALAELRAAHEAGRSALYLCFNRPLADAMRKAAPKPGTCMTFHELGDRLLKQRGEPVDYAQPGAFERLADAVVAAAGGASDAHRDPDARGAAVDDLRASVDLLIVDEGQDFEPRWAEALERMVAPAGRLLWLEDPSQNLYRRESAALPGWVTLESPVNYRSPQVIVALVNMLGLVDHEVEAGGAVHGFEIPLTEYADRGPGAADGDCGEPEPFGLDRCRTIAEPRPSAGGREAPGDRGAAATGSRADSRADSLHARTDQAVGALLDAGHAPADIAVVCWHGLASSRIAGADEIAGLRTRRFAGRYDADGRPVFTDGELQLETLFRFKGQAADCVVITEIDFDDWTDDVRRRLFVALTRARLKVALVASARAAQAISERLS